MTIQSYKDLIVWQKAMDLVEEVYLLTKGLPREEIYGLTSQLRRAAVSVPANIAEGNGRASRKDYARFISISRGSVTEVETLLQIAVRLKYLDQDHTESAFGLVDEISRMLKTMHTRLLTG